MGTSVSYGGPKGKNPLLPPWAPPIDNPVPNGDDSPVQPDGDGAPNGPDQSAPDNGGEPNSNAPAQTGSNSPNLTPWSAPKGSLSRYAGSLGGGGGQGHLRSAMRGFVRAQGGASRASQAARSGRATAQRLGGVLSTIARSGTAVAVESLGLGQFVGQDANTLLAALVDRVAPSGALLEEAAAREATIQTLEELFQNYGVQDNGFEALNTLDAEGIKNTLEKYLGNYIYTRLVQIIGQKLESRSTEDLIKVERAVKDYIFPRVRLELMDQTDMLSMDWGNAQGQLFVDQIYREGYQLIETMS